MAVNKNILIITAILSVLAVPAVASNDLVRVDLKKSASEAVDITFFTSESYADNVIVRKKSDNKYVILIPGVQSAGYKSSGLTGVKDLVSDINVKTVDDTTGGYTKITLITTKPLDIRTRSSKSLPLTAEQQEYNTLIAQANTIKNNALNDKPLPKQKTEVTVNKVPPSVQKIPAKSAVVQQSPKTVKPSAKEQLKQFMKPEKAQTSQPKVELTELSEEEVSQLAENKPEDNIPDVLPAVNEEVKPVEAQPAKRSIRSLVKKAVKKSAPYAAGLLVLAGLIKLLNSARKPENTAEPVYPKVPETAENGQELSSGEKFNMYLEKSKPVERVGNKGKYSFIKSIADEIEAKRRELEKFVTGIQPVEKIESEDEVIRRTIKFKAFDTPVVSLKMSNRNGRFKKYEQERPLHEQKTINLEDSSLYSNPRSLADANLKVSDVDKNRIQPKQNYEMSTVEEYLAIEDREKEEIKEKYKNELKIKSVFKIDKDKGFYLISKDGKNTLVGKVKDDISVIKRFARDEETPIQIRQDKDNVYMVKAGDFKSLVEVNDDKMGVLIEL